MIQELSLDNIKSHAAKMVAEPQVKKAVEGVIKCGAIEGMTANMTAESVKDMPEPKDLFMGMWHEHEICILFGDNGCGKSIMAQYIMYNLCSTGARGLYLDFELTKWEFAKRMKDANGTLHLFPDTFIRGHLSADANLDDEQAIIDSIEEFALKNQTPYIAIDNISYLCIESEKGSESGRFMRKLNALKDKHGWSFLVVAHTPKIPKTEILDKNHLAGSKRLSNFIQSLICIGRSANNKNLRYMKQLKVRSYEEQLEHGEVYELELVRDPFIHFEVIGVGKEIDHLPNKEVAPLSTKTPQTSEELLLEWMSDGNLYSRQGIRLMSAQKKVNGNTMMSALQRLIAKGYVKKEDEGYRVIQS